jgi:hypothetical protein
MAYKGLSMREKRARKPGKWKFGSCSGVLQQEGLPGSNAAADKKKDACSLMSN